MSDPIVLIPARMAATRLPNKPMADLAGEPMIVHVWRRAVEAGIGPVVVATDTPAIVETIEAVGGLGAAAGERGGNGRDEGTERGTGALRRGGHTLRGVLAELLGTLPRVVRCVGGGVEARAGALRPALARGLLAERVVDHESSSVVGSAPHPALNPRAFSTRSAQRRRL